MRRCNFCFEAICCTQADSHICGGKANLKHALPPKTGKQIALEILKDSVEDPDSRVDYDLDPQPMVYCHNLEGLICHITSERKVEVIYLLKLIEFGRVFEGKSISFFVRYPPCPLPALECAL